MDLTERFDTAVLYALAAHRQQPRKGTDIPYAAHLLAVAAMLLDDGYDETTAIVGLLHDVVEDQGGDDRLNDVSKRFGTDVAAAVAECSAEEKSVTQEWRPRKERYIAQMRESSTTAVRVSLADKVHNLASIVDDYRTLGESLWSRFNATGPQEIVWYYSALLDVYGDRVDELRELRVDQLRRLVGELAILLRPACPRCEAADVLPVIVGLPGPDLLDLEMAGEVVLAGCVVGPAPDWSCRACGFDWQDVQRRESW